MATDEPTDSPTDEPTKQPSHNPTTRDPTKMPSPHPTTAHPTRHPTTSDPTKHPSHNPTTAWPTKRPSHQPTTMDPTKRPSESPTTSDPTRRPTSGTYLAPEPTKKPTHSPKPTWKKHDHESYEKDAVSHIYNPYDIRQRGIVKAQLKERIESDKQELAALNELETVSDEQQDLDESASTDETVQKEAVSHIFNPYDIRKRRSAMRAAIEKSIDDEIAGLAELDELERQEEDGVKQVESSKASCHMPRCIFATALPACNMT